ncbi:MAG: aminoacetone oxidase family FAD-binding enzyme [Clostridia bacterium]|nr:aminoacetone oxidase family FAD-binding enzyme [Clostridia bacterium]
MKNYDVVIIGCGASGCMAALNCKNKKVAVIDLNTKPAKKLLATGNGRCNITNKNIDSCFYNQNIDGYLNRFNQFDTLKFFNSLGLETYFDEEGRCYPISNSAKSVVDVLTNNIVKKADLFLQEKVCDVICEKTNGRAKFFIKTDKDVYCCNKLVVACGSGDVLKVIARLNVKTKPFVSSLVSLKSSQIKDLNGIKVSDVIVTATNGKQIVAERGEVLFKDGGLSGIVIFNLSSLFSRNGSFVGEVSIDLLPDVSKQDLILKLQKRKELNVSVDKFFVGFFQNALANEVFKQAHINTNLISTKLTNKQIEDMAHAIKGLKFGVNGAFDNNQVNSGGVCIGDLDGNLMSLKTPNLFFCGEVCDVDGVCGGYNLQWAWTSGKIVGDSL